MRPESGDDRVRPDLPGGARKLDRQFSNDDTAVRCRPAHYVQLLIEDTRSVAETLKVGRTDSRDHRIVGRRDFGQATDLAGRVAPELEDPDVGFIRRGEDRQRHANLVVQVALSRVYRPHA